MKVVGNNSTVEKENKNLTNKANAMFDDLDFEDDFSDGEDDNKKSKKNGAAADLDFA